MGFIFVSRVYFSIPRIQFQTFVSQPGEDVVAKVEMFRRGANYTAMWLPKMEWIVSVTHALHC